MEKVPSLHLAVAPAGQEMLELVGDGELIGVGVEELEALGDADGRGAGVVELEPEVVDVVLDG